MKITIINTNDEKIIKLNGKEVGNYKQYDLDVSDSKLIVSALINYTDILFDEYSPFNDMEYCWIEGKNGNLMISIPTGKNLTRQDIIKNFSAIDTEVEFVDQKTYA